MRRFAIACILTLLLPRLAVAEVTLRLSTSAPPSDVLTQALTTFQRSVETATAGSVKVSVFPANTLFRQGAEIPAIERGTLDMSTGTTFEVADEVPALGLFDRAYLFRDYAQMHSVFAGPIGAAYKQRVLDKMGIRILAVLYLGTRQLALRTDRPVAGPQDLAGVKLRMVAGRDWLLLGRALGASPVPMGMPEVYLAMQTGTIDGEDNPLSIVAAAKLYEVSKEIVLTAHMVQPVFIDIGERAWKKLDAAQQAAVMAAAQQAQEQNDAARLAQEKDALALMTAKGLRIVTPDLAAFRAKADTVYAASGAVQGWDQPMLRQVLGRP